MSRPRIDRVGEIYGRLTILEQEGSYSWCECECGNDSIKVQTSHLVSKATTSCGCVRRERVTTHGMSNNWIYNMLRKMNDRCHNKRCKCYPSYGGSSIFVYENWREEKYGGPLGIQGFLNFFTYLKKHPKILRGLEEGKSIDRINNNKGYKPGNIRAATRKEQQNNIQNNVFISFRGHRKTIAQWTDHTGIAGTTLWYRFNNPNLSIEQALTTPTRTGVVPNVIERKRIRLNK